MSRRRRLRRRLLWAGLLFGLVLLYATVSALRVCVWCRDAVAGSAGRMREKPRKGGSMYARFSLVAVVAVATMAFAVPAAWGDPWSADRLAQAQQAASSYPDWFERYVAAHSIREPVGDDHFRDPQDAVPVAVTSGTELEWPRVGIALGVGALLALSLFLTVRLTRVRSLAP
jgi:ABC-type Fe3+-siderophore transport system permease subunit